MGLNGAAERSHFEAAPPDEQASQVTELDRLGEAVRRLLQSGVAWRARALAAEQRCHEAQAALDAVRTGTLDPRELGERVARLEAENESLRLRLRSAEKVAQRIHARLHLLEEER
ncbi:MAG: hypothetical protein FIB01_13735 [Gemmatimonadetes bacterium]|nr:hypothetical protein [Gemmatimonadota bacterium]